LTQALSPSVQDGTHKQGILVNSLTQDALVSPCNIIPVFAFKNYVKFRPREEGGGIIYKSMEVTEEVKADLQWVDNKPPAVTAFINVVCLVEGQDMPLIVSFCKTSYTAGQNLITLMSLDKNVWMHSYTLEPKKVTNTKGTFFVFTVKRGAPTNEAKIAECAALYAAVKDIAIDTDYEEEGVPVEGAAPKEF
jgi:hypothetical protein